MDEEKRHEPWSDNPLVKIFGPLISLIAGAALGWLPAKMAEAIGPYLPPLGVVAGGIAGLIFYRYVGVLGAGNDPKGSQERKAYDALRKSLRGGNLAARLYSEWLTKFLDGVDRFFGDADKADRTLFPRAFGLKTPAPLWTAPAFDRCLLLALIYPMATILIIWAVSGHVGPAEAALKLRVHMEGWQRGVGAGLVVVSIFSSWRRLRTQGFAGPMWFAIALATAYIAALTGAGALALAVGVAIGVASTFVPIASGTTIPGFVVVPSTVAGAFVGVGIGGSAIIGAFAGAIIGLVVGTVIGAIVHAFARALAHAFIDAFAGVGVVAGAVVVAVAFNVATNAISAIPFAFALAVVVSILNDIGIRRQRQGVFLSLYLLAMVIFCLGTAVWLPPLDDWSDGGPLLLFLGLLTLVNAPFDWASLGLTRALLRRGLELGGWWPYFLAFIDALAAAFIIALLAITMVIGVQTFDHLAEHSGGADARVLPLDKLFDGIAAQPSAPEYWWVYTLLLSTMIPSLLNLMIGGASLLRGIPGLPALLLRFMPANKAVATFDRTWLALVLTCQVFAGAFLGIAAQFILAFGVLFYVLPWMGVELLYTAIAVADYDLPMRVLRLWWGN